MNATLYETHLEFGKKGGMEAVQSAYDPMTTPYEVDEAAYPLTGTPEEQCTFLLRYVILSPSTHNTQPWRFAVSREGIAVYGDYTRRMPVVDPGHRELLMSVGAAVFTLRVAADRFGFDCRVTYNYSGDSERPLAVVALAPRPPRTPADEALGSLFACIPRRHTNRNPFLLSRVPETLLRRIRGMSAGGGASVTVSTDGRINTEVGDLVAAAERMQLADPDFRGDLAEWVRPNWTHRPDGVTGAALGMTGIAAALTPWTTRMLDVSRMKAAADRNLCIEAPGLVVLESEEAVPHWLDSGELLQKLLLTLTREGLHHSYFNMPVQVPDLRLRLRALLGLSSWPQILLRIGFSLTAPAVTPRRPVEDVLIESPYS
ncbi:MAG: nitroreductase [Bacteroidota bacterium]